MNYFNKFPVISYDGKIAKNLLARSKFSTNTKNNKYIFYPYSVDDNTRVDNLSQDYYDSPNYSWVIWFSNDTIDPYYDLALTGDDFNKFIVNKYGSMDIAMRKIHNYRANWFSHPERLSESQFNTLYYSYKKYYEPVLNIDLSLNSYKIKEEDIFVNTNKIIGLSITPTNNKAFILNEEVQVTTDAASYAFCTYSDSTVVTVQHIHGSFNTGNTIIGKESGATATISNVTVISETMASIDQPYWTAVSNYDYENELNETKKHIRLLDVRYKSQIEQQLKKTMGAK